jgi:hypothetical protein
MFTSVSARCIFSHCMTSYNLFFLTKLVIFPIPLALLLPSMLKNFSVVENWKSLAYIYCDYNVIKGTQDHWSKTKEGLNSINVSDQNLWYFLKMLKWQSLIVKPYSHHNYEFFNKFYYYQILPLFNHPEIKFLQSEFRCLHL